MLFGRKDTKIYTVNKNNIMKEILNKLEITRTQYESIMWNLYYNWCQGVTTNNRELQQVLANSAINSWFRIELTKCEADFLEKTRFYTNSTVTAKDYNRCYTECLYSLFSIRPMPLLKEIVKPKVQGISVFNALHIN